MISTENWYEESWIKIKVLLIISSKSRLTLSVLTLRVDVSLANDKTGGALTYFSKLVRMCLKYDFGPEA